jgi:hypothetical protein
MPYLTSCREIEGWRCFQGMLQLPSYKHSKLLSFEVYQKIFHLYKGLLTMYEAQLDLRRCSSTETALQMLNQKHCNLLLGC